MIVLSNGHTFEYMTASGALAYDGRGWSWEWPLRWLGLIDPCLFTVVTKTLTHHPRRGNLRWWKPWGCVRLIDSGTVNAVGLTNPGIEWWCRKVGPRVDRRKIALVVSLLSDDPAALAQMAQMLDKFDLVGIELNASCPNTAHELLGNAAQVLRCAERLKRASRHPLIVKLSVEHHLPEILLRLEGVAEAISINSVPWRTVFPHRTSPLVHLGGGGVSGKAAQPYTWQMVEAIRTQCSIPVIGPSVWEYADIARLRARGAQAISFGAVHIPRPWFPTLAVRRDMRERSKHAVSAATI